MTTGSMGGTCPACGRYWNARGCTPGNCKSTPEPENITVKASGDPEAGSLKVKIKMQLDALPGARMAVQPAAPEHPAPWRWGADGDDWLRAANGEIVISAGDGDTWPASPRVGELVRAAPEMEALLREETDKCLCIMIDPSTVGRRGGVTSQKSMCPAATLCWWCRGRELLARIDAAAKR